MRSNLVIADARVAVGASSRDVNGLHVFDGFCEPELADDIFTDQIKAPANPKRP
jgi:hypothetical protein